MKFFYLNNAEKQTNRTKDDYDMIYKIRQLLTLVVKAFQSVYINNQELSADDSIIGYKDSLSWIQYMPNKTTKWGIKAWVLPDFKNSYVYKEHCMLYVCMYVSWLYLCPVEWLQLYNIIYNIYKILKHDDNIEWKAFAWLYLCPDECLSTRS